MKFATTRIATAIGLSLTLGLAAATAHAAPIVVKFSHVVAENTPKGQGALKFKELAEAALPGKVEVQVFSNSQLFGDGKEMEALLLGDVQIIAPSLAKFDRYTKKIQIFDLPFMFDDMAALDRFQSGPKGQELLDSMKSKGIKGLAYWENGFRQLTNNVRPIRSPKDLEGMKMRTMENEVHIAAWKAEGANPAPLAFGELFTALQQGTFDAQEGPINLFYDMKFYEVQKYITRTNHVYSPWPLLINPDVYNGFSDQDRAIFDQVVKDTTRYQRELAQQADEKAVAAMPQVQIIDLTPEEHAAFADRMGPIYDMVKKKIGAEVVDAIVAEVNR